VTVEDNLTATERTLLHLKSEVERAWEEYQDGERADFNSTMRHIEIVARGMTKAAVKDGAANAN
jgi:hypothetical protein